MSTRQDIEKVIRDKYKTFPDYELFANRNAIHINQTPEWKTDAQRLEGNIKYVLDKVDRYPQDWYIRVCRALGLPTTTEADLDERRLGTQEARKANRNATIANVIAGLALLIAIIALVVSLRK